MKTIRKQKTDPALYVNRPRDVSALGHEEQYRAKMYVKFGG